MSPAAASSKAAQTPTDTGEASQGGASLQVSTSPLPGSRLTVAIGIPAARCQASYDAAFAKLSRTVKLPGFRKGKVPRPVLLQQIGPLRIRATALEDLVDSVFREAVVQQQINAIGQPQLSEGFEVVLARFEPGNGLSLTLELDVEPVPSLKATKGLKAEAEAISYDPARIDELLDQSRRQLATLVPVEGRAAAGGDVAEVNFSGIYSDSGAAIEGGSSAGLEVELEEGRMIPGFIEGIIGMKPGESRTVSCRFPDSYAQADAAGREAEFTISLIELKTKELPELDDAFAQQASDKSSLAELRADLESRLQEEAQRRHRANRHEALLKALVEQLEVELPETLIQVEIRNLIEQTASQIAQQGMDVKKLFTPELVRSLMDTSRPEAEQRLRRNLALRALAAAEAISVAEAEIEAKVKEVSRGLSDTSTIDPRRLVQAVADDLLNERLLEWLEAHSTITEKAPASAVDQASEAAAGSAEEGEPTGETAGAQD